MLIALPTDQISIVSRFLMPKDANRFVRSFSGVQIDWMKVLFNYARIVKLHMEWTLVVQDVSSAKTFYTNHRTNEFTHSRATAMYIAIKRSDLNGLHNAIMDCPRLFRYTFMLSDSFFVYTAMCREDGERAYRIYSFVSSFGVHTHMLTTTGLDTITDHSPTSMFKYLKFKAKCKGTFKTDVRQWFATLRSYLKTAGPTDRDMMNKIEIDSTTYGMTNALEVLLVGELYGSASTMLPISTAT